MVENKTSGLDQQKLLDEQYLTCNQYLDDAVERSLKLAISKLYIKLQEVDDSAQNDFSYATNLIEANIAWIVGKVSVGVLTELRRDKTEIDAIETEGSSDEKSHLSLVSKDEFEDWLLVDVSKKKLEREFETELGQVCKIFSILQSTHYDERTLPIGPEKILSALKKAVDTLKIPAVTQITFYRSISESLSEDLRRLYVELQAKASLAGLVLEKSLKGSVKKKSLASANSSENGFPSTANNSFQGIDNDFGGSRGGSLGTLSRLGAVLSNGNRVGASPNFDTRLKGDGNLAASISNHVHSTNVPSPFLTQLQGLANKQTYVEDSTADQDLKQWIMAELGGTAQGLTSITEKESELVEATDGLFTALTSGNQQGAPLGKWLAKLKVTILKSVLANEHFFTDINHPARLMLNKLGELSAIIGSGHTRLESLLDHSIDKVIEDYDSNDASFTDAVTQLNQVFDRHEHAFKRNSERLARSYEGKQRVASSRHRVAHDLTKLLTSGPVPQVILELLNDAGWREYMALSAIREGTDSESYRNTLETVEQLLIWLLPMRVPQNDEANHDASLDLSVEIGIEAPSLLEVLSDELSISGKVGYDMVLKRLSGCLLGDIKPKFITLDRYEWPFEDAEGDLETLQPKKASDFEKTRWHTRLSNMKSGDWLQLTDAEGNEKCLRLAWAGSESFRFVFVDSQGMKDKDLSIDELVGLFKLRRACFVDNNEVPLVDQGLHRMVESVYEDLSGQANCDTLTGLLNRQALERGLDQTVELSMSLQESSALLYADVHNFSLTNSTYGHTAGDAVLKHVAKTLRDLSGDKSFCGRLGGNEFGLILQGCELGAAQEIAESIQASLAANPVQWDNQSLPCDLSIGIAEINHEIDDYDSALRKAELACQAAKDTAISKISVYQSQDEDQKKRSELLHWVKQLDTSLDDFLTLRVQEIRPIDIANQLKSHWEILLGVKQNGTTLPPGQLIEAAEHFGKMTIVDRWVVKESLKWMEDNSKFVEGSEGFSINLSGNSLSDPDFLEFALERVESTSVTTSKICFEITETSAIVNLSCATEFIKELKSKGCKFSLDDFGSGLSSYAYIQKLPVDYIKIDGMFIRNLESNQNDQALVRSINELAHFMGIETVAEFVENYEILDVLKEIGVDHSQGYGIRKPMPIEELCGTT